MVYAIKDMFFEVNCDKLRQQIAITLKNVIENCFPDRVYGPEDKPCSELIFSVLFEEL